MGRSWAEGLKVRRVPRLEVSKPVTVIVPYYENPAWLASQLGRWALWPEAVRQATLVHVVDDGSPERPAARVVGEYLEAGGLRPPALRVFRIGVDVRWNWLAARNVGAWAAPCGWMLLTDIDHVIPVGTVAGAVYGAHDSEVVYGFSRVSSSGERLAPHPNSWLLTRERYWQIGGYDEELSGHYGTDGDWRRRVAAAGRLEILEECLVRHEYEGDSSTRRYLRKQPEDAGVRAIIGRRRPEWRPRVLSFPWSLELEVMR